MRTVHAVVDMGQERWVIYRTTPDDTLWTEYGACEGVTLKTDREIHFVSTLPQRAVMPVLRHELIHAALFTAGLDKMSEAKEEQFAVGLAAALASLLRLPRRAK